MYELGATSHGQSGPKSYEIHCRSDSGWTFWAMRGEMVEAVREAKRVLGQSGIQAVRVVRDLYDPATNTTRPNTVFRAAAAPAGGLAAWRRYWPRRRPAASGHGEAPRGLAAGLSAIGLGSAISWLRS